MVNIIKKGSKTLSRANFEDLKKGDVFLSKAFHTLLRMMLTFPETQAMLDTSSTMSREKAGFLKN